MSSSFVLELDTRAPVVQWGAVTGTTAGELLQVAYSSNEPVARARIRLADGRTLTMSVTADRLTVALPPDTPTGNARLLLEDDVRNVNQARLLMLTGALAPASNPTGPSGGHVRGTAAPARPRREPEVQIDRRLVVSATTVTLKSACLVRATPPKQPTVVGTFTTAVASTTRSSAQQRITTEQALRAVRVPGTAQEFAIASSGAVSRADDEQFAIALLLDLL